jgi:pterin-4a-carbinolamine dehydratase
MKTQKTLGKLMEGYLTKPNSNAPVNVSVRELPIMPLNRWQLEDKRKLRKRYSFETISQRNHFMTQLLQYEGEKNHFADLAVTNEYVEVCIYTKNIEAITELDKEYAKFVDILYKDVMYVPEHEPKLSY